MRFGKELVPGLGFIGVQVFVDQHVLVCGCFARMILAMSAAYYPLGDGTDLRPELGFKFEFRRTAETVGYLSSSTESFTAMNIRLDIRPVKIRFPWYD